jgi:site-specific DNA-methyltransferase (adenine-specific)
MQKVENIDEPPAFAKHVLGAVPSVVYNEDCVEGLKRFSDNHFDLAIVDPPYGMSRTKMNIGGRDETKIYKGGHFDEEKPTAEYWEQLFRVSKNQIVWGGNYFTTYLPEKSGWIIWQKHINPNATAFSAAELAWSSFDKKVMMFVRSVGMDVTDAVNGKMGAKRIHSCQKPIELYDFILANNSKEGDLILDTHLGSGSSRIACQKNGFNFTGFEIDKDYYEAQEKRFKDFVSQLRMF